MDRVGFSTGTAGRHLFNLGAATYLTMSKGSSTSMPTRLVVDAGRRYEGGTFVFQGALRPSFASPVHT